MKKDNLYVIIAAGGSGERFGKNKLLEKLKGTPVFIHSIKTFLNIVPQSKMSLVCHKNNIKQYEELLSDFDIHIKLVIGGKTRTESIYNGLKTIEEKCKYVAIHDAARPLISEKIIEECYIATTEYGAAAPAKYLADTIKQVDGDFILKTVDRSSLVAIETPQMFVYDTLLKGYETVLNKKISITDDTSIYEVIDEKVFFVENNSCNKKITYLEDLLEAEFYLNKLL